MPSRVAAIHPLWAIEGGRITVAGTDFPTDRPRLPEVRIGEAPARVVYASPVALSAIVPAGLEGGPTTVRIEGVAGETGFIDVGLTMPDENVSRVPFGRTRKIETGTCWPRVPL